MLLPEAEGAVTDYLDADLLGSNYKQIFGSVMSNFAFVITVPSWCNEKKPHVSVNGTIWLSIIVCVVIYGSLGFLAAAVFGNRITESTNFLALMSTHHSRSLTAITCQFFPLLTALTGVPVCSIICRYNLLQSRISRNVFTANLIAVVLPWVISVPLQTMGNGSALQDLLDWGSLLFSSICNVVIPFILYVYYKRSISAHEDKGLQSGLLSSVTDEWEESSTIPEHWALPGRQDSRLKIGFAWVTAVLMFSLILLTVMDLS